MISYLQGNLILRGKDFLIIDVNGVGYKVFISEKTLSKLPENEQQLKLYTFLHSREETSELYGFLTYAELELFEVLNRISGIGPRTAMTLASFGSLENLKKVIESQDEKFLKGIKGIGRKKMQKITLEITGRIKERKQIKEFTEEDDEALKGLISLGFSRQQAKETLSHVSSEVKDTSQRIKEALKLLGR